MSHLTGPHGSTRVSQRQKEEESMVQQSLRSGFRGNKISPAILINRRYTAIDFCLPNVNKGSQN